MKYAIYARKSGFLDWLFDGWHIIKICNSKTETLLFINDFVDPGYCYTALEFDDSTTIPFKFRFWPKCNTLETKSF